MSVDTPRSGGQSSQFPHHARLAKIWNSPQFPAQFWNGIIRCLSFSCTWEHHASVCYSSRYCVWHLSSIFVVHRICNFRPQSIKVHSVVQLMSFKDKLPENFTFVMGNAIIFPVYSVGFFSPFLIAGFCSRYYINQFKVCYWMGCLFLFVSDYFDGV